MTRFADYSVRADIALGSMKGPPVNGLGVGMRSELLSRYQKVIEQTIYMLVNEGKTFKE